MASYSFVTFILSGDGYNESATRDMCSRYSNYPFLTSGGYSNPNLTGANALLVKNGSNPPEYIVSYNYLCPFNIFATYDDSSVSSPTIIQNASSLGSHAHEIFNGGSLVVSGKQLYGTYRFGGVGSIEFVRDLSTSSAITEIGDNMFDGCESLTTVRLPWSTSVEIGYASFRSCQHLEYFFCYNRVRKVGEEAFYGCTSLKGNEIACGDYVNRTLSNISRLQDCLKVCFECDSKAFQNCTSITKIAFHDSKRYDYSSDGSSYDLTNVASSNYFNQYSIRDYAFANCTSLSSICSYYTSDYNYEVRHDNDIFISFKNIRFPYESVYEDWSWHYRYRGKGCFENCTSLNGTLILEFNTTTDVIPENMFYNCSGITSLRLETGSVKIAHYKTDTTTYYIEDGAFAYTSIGCDEYGIFHDDLALAELNKILDDTSDIGSDEIRKIFGRNG